MRLLTAALALCGTVALTAQAPPQARLSYLLAQPYPGFLYGPFDDGLTDSGGCVPLYVSSPAVCALIRDEPGWIDLSVQWSGTSPIRLWRRGDGLYSCTRDRRRLERTTCRSPPTGRPVPESRAGWRRQCRPGSRALPRHPSGPVGADPFSSGRAVRLVLSAELHAANGRDVGRLGRCRLLPVRVTRSRYGRRPPRASSKASHRSARQFQMQRGSADCRRDARA